jgi:hypothetical protein
MFPPRGSAASPLVDVLAAERLRRDEAIEPSAAQLDLAPCRHGEIQDGERAGRKLQAQPREGVAVAVPGQRRSGFVEAGIGAARSTPRRDRA